MRSSVRIIKSNAAAPHFNGDRIQWVETLSRWMDSKFLIPGTNIRFGIDPIVSLFPVFGDFLTFLISGALIYTMHRHGASGKVVIKMVLNATLDTVIGAIPLVGTVFDIFYRANDRNVKLLREYYFEGKHQGSGKGLLGVIVVMALLLIAGIFYGMWKLLEVVF
ncbi:MAG TPA: DUF4112 domain-containing protein [Ohtaekwangia sp.]|nr:DUF4112 domain-containing protein [Ohtaekwangia sp.]